MTPKRIVIHNTANDAPAENEISYMLSRPEEVSFHFAIPFYLILFIDFIERISPVVARTIFTAGSNIHTIRCNNLAKIRHIISKKPVICA